MHFVRSPLTSADRALPEIAVRADRSKLARKIWRGTAEDGTDFGFELEAPLAHGDAIWANANALYVIRQDAEPVLEIPLDLEPDAAAVLGWAAGNLHLPIEAQPGRLLAPDDPGLRQTLERLGAHYHSSVEVFRPHRFAGNLIGHGHTHGHASSG
jgi:urease accessory protein